MTLVSYKKWIFFDFGKKFVITWSYGEYNETDWKVILGAIFFNETISKEKANTYEQFQEISQK